MSSLGSDFNFDYNVSFSQQALARGEVLYNYVPQTMRSTEMPGISAFFKHDGQIFHTHSTYGRGLDMLNAAYQYLDIAPQGRDEAGLPSPMAWVKHRVDYES